MAANRASEPARLDGAHITISPTGRVYSTAADPAPGSTPERPPPDDGLLDSELDWDIDRDDPGCFASSPSSPTLPDVPPARPHSRGGRRRVTSSPILIRMVPTAILAAKARIIQWR
jgi:hypothetical protein